MMQVSGAQGQEHVEAALGKGHVLRLETGRDKIRVAPFMHGGHALSGRVEGDLIHAGMILSRSRLGKPPLAASTMRATSVGSPTGW